LINVFVRLDNCVLRLPYTASAWRDTWPDALRVQTEEHFTNVFTHWYLHY